MLLNKLNYKFNINNFVIKQFISHFILWVIIFQVIILCCIIILYITSLSSKLGTYRMDEQGASPPLMASYGNTPIANLMDIDFSLNNTLRSKKDILGHN